MNLFSLISSNFFKIKLHNFGKNKDSFSTVACKFTKHHHANACMMLSQVVWKIFIASVTNFVTQGHRTSLLTSGLFTNYQIKYSFFARAYQYLIIIKFTAKMVIEETHHRWTDIWLYSRKMLSVNKYLASSCMGEPSCNIIWSTSKPSYIFSNSIICCIIQFLNLKH